eukprot:7816-Heterococcus_DN1.PRE.9
MAEPAHSDQHSWCEHALARCMTPNKLTLRATALHYAIEMPHERDVAPKLTTATVICHCELQIAQLATLSSRGSAVLACSSGSRQQFKCNLMATTELHVGAHYRNCPALAVYSSDRLAVAADIDGINMADTVEFNCMMLHVLVKVVQDRDARLACA